MDTHLLEGVAQEFLEATGCDTDPGDAFELASLFGLTIRADGRERIDLRGSGTIYVDTRNRRERQHGTVAHELGHALLDCHRLPQSERAASYLAGALIWPWRAFGRALNQCGWDLYALRQRNLNASFELIAWRLTQYRPEASVQIFDNRRLKKTIGAPVPARVPATFTVISTGYRRVIEVRNAG